MQSKQLIKDIMENIISVKKNASIPISIEAVITDDSDTKLNIKAKIIVPNIDIRRTAVHLLMQILNGLSSVSAARINASSMINNKINASTKTIQRVVTDTSIVPNANSTPITVPMIRLMKIPMQFVVKEEHLLEEHIIY